MQDTALLRAGHRGDDAAIRTLLNQGANAEARCTKGATPLHYAAAGGHMQAVRALAQQLGGTQEAVDVQDHEGSTPLHHAAREGQVTSLMALLAYGARMDATLPATGDTPLHLAAGGNRQAVSAALVQAGASLTAVNAEGLTPLNVCGRESVRHVMLRAQLERQQRLAARGASSSIHGSCAAGGG